MKSAKCIHCGLINWASEEACKRCGNPPQRTVAEEFGGRAPHPPPPFPHAGVKRQTGLAAASLVVGILSLLTLSFFLVGGLTALALGIVALTRAQRQPHLYGGRGMAVGGVVTSALSLVVAVPLALILAVVIPNLLAARRKANEAMAIHTINEILVAENEYMAVSGQGEYGSLEQLVESGLLEPPILSRLKNGYHFRLDVSEGDCEVSAVPWAYGSSGTRSFYATCEDIRVRHADRRGLPANSTDPVVYDPDGMRMLDSSEPDY